LSIVLSVLLPNMDSDWPFGIFKPFFCRSLFVLLEQTTQWTKEQGQKDKQRSTKEEFEDTTGSIRIHIWKKNRQHNVQKNTFVDRCLSFCPFSFVHCVVCSSPLYGFWLTLWYLQTLLLYNGQRKQNTKRQTTIYKRRVWRYHRVNQNSYIDEEQTTQWTKEQGQKDKQRSTLYIRILINSVVSSNSSFVDRCLSFCPCSFVHCVVCSSPLYGFWLTLSKEEFEDTTGLIRIRI
jgi:hypothetical protein